MDIFRQLYMNKDIFLAIENNEVVAWNYRSDRRHAISLDAIRALIDTDFRRKNPALLKELEKADILTTGHPQSAVRWKWDDLSRIFHFGTKVEPNGDPDIDPTEALRSYVEYCTSIMDEMPADAFSTTRGEGDVELRSEPCDRINHLLDLFDRRRTNRTFGGDPIAFGDISLILDETFRYREHDLAAFARKGLYTATSRRSAPSGGSLQSCEAYLIARNVADLRNGVYHYRSHRRNLGFIGGLEKKFSFGKLLCEQMFADDLGAAIVISCRLDKLMWKYRESRAYRAALLDAGHLSQNLQLIATALGVRTWPTAAFYDDRVGVLLKLKEDSLEYPLLVVGLGTGEVNPFDRNFGVGFL